MVEELVSSVLPFWKGQVGMLLTMIMLNPTSLVKEKVVIFSTKNAAAAKLISMSSVLEVAEAVLLMEDLVVNALVILNPMDASMLILILTMIVTIQMVKIMLDSLHLKSMEEVQKVNALLVL